MNARVNDIVNDARYEPFFEKHYLMKTKCVLAVPIKDSLGKITGSKMNSNYF